MKIAPKNNIEKHSREGNENPFALNLLRPNQDEFTRITRIGDVLFT